MTNELWEDNEYPLAYLITFRTFGTWLHGDERESVDRHGHNIYGTPRRPPNVELKERMSLNSGQDAFFLDLESRSVVDGAIRNVCSHRGYSLYAANVRSNHAHAVVRAFERPERLLNAFKANATRELRAAGLVSQEHRIWSRGGSTRYLWKPPHLDGAIDYVLYCQGDDFLNF